jgi:hypothetical protein
MLILRSPVAVGMRLAPRAVAAARSHQDYQGADQQHQRPTYRLYEVQNGNHIETYKDTFPQLELIQPHAQNAFAKENYTSSSPDRRFEKRCTALP